MPPQTQMKLLFRGSEDGFKSKIFHQKCDNQGPTLTMVLTKNKKKIFGGYTDISWQLSGEEKLGKGNSFIFA